MAKMRFPFGIKFNGVYVEKNTDFEVCDKSVENLIQQGGKVVTGGENNGGARKTKAQASQ